MSGAAAMNDRMDEADRLGDEIAELAGHLHAVTHRLLVLLAEYDRSEAWSSGWGFRSCAHWLSWRTGIDPGAAREKVRVARALERLPLLSAALRRGEVSYSKVRAVTRVCTPENEAELLEVARCGTASQVERIVRAWRRVDRLEEEQSDRARHDARTFTMYIDDDGMYVVRGRLTPEAGAVLDRAVDAAAGVLHRRTRDAVEDTSPAQCRADAVGLLAECALSGRAVGADADGSGDDDGAAAPADGAADDPVGGAAATKAGVRGPRPSRRRGRIIGRAERYQVVVHVDAEALREGSAAGQSVLGDGIHVSAETSRRIACDATVVVMKHDAAGRALDVGRRTRSVPPSIRRALDHRDRRCRFPGCDARHCDAHHLQHWADGGATRLDNLVLLCRRHHRAVHEQGFRVARTQDGGFEFRTPDGRLLPEVPAAPMLPADATSHVKAEHAAKGLAMGPHTAESSWNGGPLDLNLALWMLRRPPAA